MNRGGRFIRLGLILLITLSGAACNEAVSPDDVSLDGFWYLELGNAPSEFEMELVERPGGVVSGYWSFPSIFNFHAVRGVRKGLDVELNADSPNLLPAEITARFVATNRLEGNFYFGGQNEAVILRRGRAPESPR